MAYDLEEQEQIASFKAFWSKYGNLITWVLILALGSFAAYNFWNSHTRKQSVEASALYDELTDAVTAKDNAKSQRIAADIQSKYKRTAYAQMSALAAAKTAFETNDLKTTKAQLQWVLDNGDDEYQSVARLRLAGVLLDEKNFDGAMKLLNEKFLPQFSAEVSDRKGDVLVAQNKIADARAAYVAALTAMGPKHPGSQLVRIKLEAIGGTAPAAPKAA
ncbi:MULTISPECIES: tetratricopeptide repeat protein [unclassified Massilia]|uniref:YfgM family protein n=1 Tax=unclassified Massilia TaxID=2609279 RepID=UPI0017851718|nr:MULTISPECIES: tetratricopeptide repeat protein [unclassified Massilia]MBD8532536.1 tetratricopeptide repeat protein [Massilia sp. CFBP 13647]MBD8672974.1 tetratricopeptide repeat protein [Massilia sp. CFBP 13721]